MEDPLSSIGKDDSGAFGDVDGFGPDSLVEDEPTMPPPAYDSLMLSNDEAMMHSGSQAMPSGGQASTSAAPPGKTVDGPKDFEIFVTDPVKQGEGVGAYVSYKVWSKTLLPQYKSTENEVIRRYKDFDWLFTRLQTTNRGIIVPPLPEKNAVSKISATTDFIESRRRGLQVFINRVAEHPILKTSDTLQLFLEGSEIEWRTEVDRVTAMESRTGNKLSDTIQFFKDLQHSASNMMAGKSDDEEEDPEYLKVKEYVTLLEGHLTEAHRQSTRLVKKQNKMADALAAFGASSCDLSGMESGHVQTSFQLLGEKAQELAGTIKEQTNDVANTFEAPLKEFCKMVKCVRAVMADRSSAMSAYQQFKQDAWAKRNKLTKLKGTPGVKEEKVAAAERELNEATTNAEKAKQDYEEIVHRMADELTRFQKERAVEMASVLREFAVAQAKLSSDTAKAWRELIPQISPGVSDM